VAVVVAVVVVVAEAASNAQLEVRPRLLVVFLIKAIAADEQELVAVVGPERSVHSAPGGVAGVVVLTRCGDR